MKINFFGEWAVEGISKAGARDFAGFRTVGDVGRILT
jgi:hypothetical protein